MKYETIRATVLKAALDSVSKGLIHGTSGNIAMRDANEKNIIAITPSSIPYDSMSPSDISIVRMNDDGTNEWIDGPYKPSSEVPLHTAVMRARPEINATVHTHSMYATICAMGKDPQLLPLTPPHCEFTPIGVVPFALPGSIDTANDIVRILGNDGLVCLIKNHGMFAAGKDMIHAMYAAEYTEEMAQMTVVSKTLGTYEPMTEEDVKETKAFFAAGMAV